MIAPNLALLKRTAVLLLACVGFAAVAGPATMGGQSSASNLQPQDRILFADRVYKTSGPSHVDSMILSATDRQPVNISDAEKNLCQNAAPHTDVPAAAQARAESSMAGNGNLRTWSEDATMFAYVARDPQIPPPVPNPWACTDCFYPILKITRASDLKILTTLRLPDFSEHWNFPEVMAWAPDGKTLLLGAEAGSSDGHFEDYWLLNRASLKWQYIGGGNDARWSPGSSQILWTTPRKLAPLGKIHVWVSHLVLFDLQTRKQTLLTAGTSYVSDPSWCATK